MDFPKKTHFNALGKHQINCNFGKKGETSLRTPFGRNDTTIALLNLK